MKVRRKMKQIRTLSPNELDEHFKLSQFAFQYERTEEQLERLREQTDPSTILGCFIDGKLASKVAVLPLTTYIHGEPFKMGGVASVASWPEHRRQGIVGELLQHSLLKMKEAGQTVSMLAPFSFSFYGKYGWGHFTHYKAYTLKLTQLPRFPNYKGTFERIGTTEEDIVRLNDIYDQYAKKYNGPLKRELSWWNHRIFQWKKGTVAIYINEEQQETGYIFYEVKESRMNIHEMVALDTQSFKALWAFIYQHDSMIESVHLNVPMDDELPLLLKEPAIEQKIHPYFMFRVVDVESFLKQFPFQVNEQLEGRRLFLHVTDEHASWNNGTYSLLVQNGNVILDTFKVNTEGAACVHPPKKGIICKIQSLSTMFCSYKRPTQLRDLGMLQGSDDDIQLLEQLLPHAKTCLLDFF